MVYRLWLKIIHRMWYHIIEYYL